MAGAPEIVSAHYEGRRVRVAREFPRLLVTDPEDVLWLTGFRTRLGPAYLWLDEGEWTLVVPSDAAADAPGWANLREYVGYEPQDPDGGEARAGAEVRALVGARPYAISSEFPSFVTGSVSPVATGADLLAGIRARKDPDEINLIRANVAMLDAGLGAACREVQAGSTEAEIWAALVASLIRSAGDDVVPRGNLGSGPRSLADDPRASHRRLEEGDVVLLDAYPSIRGYGADLTRTWVCGQPNADLIRAHAAVLQALEGASGALRPGVTGHEFDAWMRKALQEIAEGATYGHHTGHGFGVRQWERPWLTPTSTDVLEAGMVVAVEPAWYLPGLGGVRLEQDFVISEEGAEPLSRFPFGLAASSGLDR